MSKKHKKLGFQAATQSAGVSHSEEYRIIKSDLIKVVILNAIYLIAILALYYSNRSSGFLDNWFAKVLHF
jgi:hypothetical protein